MGIVLKWKLIKHKKENKLKFYNTKTMKSITVLPSKKYEGLVYKKQIRFLGITFRESGYYYKDCGFLGYNETLPPEYYLKPEGIYIKDRVLVEFLDGSDELFYFDRFEFAKSFAGTLKSTESGWIKQPTK